MADSRSRWVYVNGAAYVDADRFEEAEAERDEWRDRQEQMSYVQQCVSDRLVRTEVRLAEALQALEGIASVDPNSIAAGDGRLQRWAQRVLSRAKGEDDDG